MGTDCICHVLSMSPVPSPWAWQWAGPWYLLPEWMNNAGTPNWDQHWAQTSQPCVPSASPSQPISGEGPAVAPASMTKPPPRLPDTPGPREGWLPPTGLSVLPACTQEAGRCSSTAGCRGRPGPLPCLQMSWGEACSEAGDARTTLARQEAEGMRALTLTRGTWVAVLNSRSLNGTR